MANPNRGWSNYLQGTLDSLGGLSLFKKKDNTGDGFVMMHRGQAGPRYEKFPFHLLPPEIRIMIVQALGSEFFCEYVRRLTICREWHSVALSVMYNNMNIGRISHPNTPWGVLPDTAEPDYQQQAYLQVHTHLRSCSLNLDTMLRRYQFVPGDCDSSDYPDIFSRREIDDLKPDRNQMPFFVGPVRGEPWDPQDGLLWSEYRLAYLAILPRIEQFEIIVREAWGIHRLQVAAFETRLCGILECIGGKPRLQMPSLDSNLSVLVLDLPGLARRSNSWSHQHEVDGIVHPMFLLDGALSTGLDDDMDHQPSPDDARVGRHSTRHVCYAVRTVLPRLETLHLRLRSVCPSLFRDWNHEKRPWLKRKYPGFEDVEDHEGDDDGLFASVPPELGPLKSRHRKQYSPNSGR